MTRFTAILFDGGELGVSVKSAEFKNQQEAWVTLTDDSLHGFIVTKRQMRFLIDTLTKELEGGE
jgi:hypothetical protein